MNDKELLEYAAIAAGVELSDLYDDIGDHGEIERRGWNPLEDDGDALRLAFKLRIDIEWQHIGYVSTDEVECYVKTDSNWYKTYLDKAENYRRVIVECAADNGKAKSCP